jgi:hypothetical protein
MKGFNSASPIDSQFNLQPSIQSNIVPFESSSLRSRRSQDTKTSIWERFWDTLFKLMIPSSEPRITQSQGPNGDESYQVYDPATGRSKTFSSELETRIWLDRRFYENPRNL